jgi:6-phosphofructokinase
MSDQMMKIFLAYRFDDAQAGPITISDGNGGQLTLLLTPEQFVHRVKYHLSTQASLEPFCYAGEKGRLDWDEVIRNQLATSNKLVLFWSGTMGDTESIELGDWQNSQPGTYQSNTILVRFPKCTTLPREFNVGSEFIIEVDDLYGQVVEDLPRIVGPNAKTDVRRITDLVAAKCAETIFEKMKLPRRKWVPCDGLPLGYPFDYEKDIIQEFVESKGGLVTSKRLQQGCPLEWPEVARVKPTKPLYPNPIPELIRGKPRLDSHTIIVDGRSQYHNDGHRSNNHTKECCLIRLPKPLWFLEAGPRESIAHPLGDDLRIGIVVSGGIAPGINAVIAGICSRHVRYQQDYEKWLTDERDRGNRHEGLNPYRLFIVMYRDGFSGMLDNHKIEFEPLEALSHVNEHSNLGGSWISTARHDDLLDSNDRVERNKKLDALINILVQRNEEIDILYVIGGEGTMRAAHAIATRARQRWLSGSIERQISVVGVPKTMDNDILWVWQAFGFLSAVEKAKEFISQLATEAKSNPRLCIVQLFGSDSGFVVSHAGLASGVCKAALIPEIEFTLEALSEYIREQLGSDMKARDKRLGQSPCGIILLAETAIPSDVENYIDNPAYRELQLTEKEKGEIRKYIGSASLNCEDIEDWPAFLSELAAGTCPYRQLLRRRIFELLPPSVQHIVNGYTGARRQEQEVPFEIQSLIIRSLNSIIKDKDLAEAKEKEWTSPAESPSPSLRNFSQYMTFVDKCSRIETGELKELFEHLLFRQEILCEPRLNPVAKYPERVVQALENYPVSYKARTKIGLLRDRMSRDHLLKVIVGNADKYPLSEDARKKVEEIVKHMSAADKAILARGDVALAEWMDHFRGYSRDLYAELKRTCNRLLLEEAFMRGDVSAEHETSARRKPSPGYISRLSTAGERRVHGQTPDELRSGGSKVVSAVLQHDIRKRMERDEKYWEHFRVFVNEPRHLIRAIPPSVSDIIFGQRLGVLAVDNAMAGCTDFMVSQWVTEYVLVPLELVVLGRKRVPQNGIFWKSVLQNTGQPATMV